VDWSFSAISALTALASGLGLAVLGLFVVHTRRQCRALRPLLESVQPHRVADTLAQFEANIVARVQKTERAFVDLGDEVTETLERVTKLRNSASASASRAARIKEDTEAVQQQAAPIDTNPFENPNLSRDEKMQLVRDDLTRRGISL